MTRLARRAPLFRARLALGAPEIFVTLVTLRLGLGILRTHLEASRQGGTGRSDGNSVAWAR